MQIIKGMLAKCDHCQRMHGHIVEKYNGLVPVYCNCDLKDSEKRLANPSAIYNENADPQYKIRWKPISDYRRADGSWVHVPWFA